MHAVHIARLAPLLSLAQPPRPASADSRFFMCCARACIAQLARTHERLFCTVGVHPTNCGQFEAAPESEEGGAASESAADASAHPLGEDHLAALLALAKEGAAEGKVRGCAACCAYAGCTPVRVALGGRCGEHSGGGSDTWRRQQRVPLTRVIACSCT